MSPLYAEQAEPSAQNAQAACDRRGATAAWAHFLAFDLFVGRWIYLDSRSRGTSDWVTGPILFLTLLPGPLGLIVYFIARQIYYSTSGGGAEAARQNLEGVRNVRKYS